MNVSTKVRYLIAERKLNVSKMADLMGIHQSGLSYKLINNSFSIDDMVKIAEVTNTQLEINFVFKNGNKI